MSESIKTYKFLKDLCACLMMAIAPFAVLAQDAGFAGGSFHMGFNARGLAMGNAMSAVTTQGTYSYYNPALSALKADHKQTDFSVASMSFDRYLQTASINFQLPPSAGLSFLLIHTGVRDIDGRSVSGYPTEIFNAGEFQLRGDFGLRLSERIYGGIGIKFSLADHHPDLQKASSFGLDLGLLLNTDSPINLAISVKDLFAGYNWDTQSLYSLDQSFNTLNEFPTRITFGSAYQSSKWTISADFEYLVSKTDIIRDNIIIINGIPSSQRTTENVTATLSQLRLGSSVNIHERMTLRAGWGLPTLEKTESWNLSTGFSLHLPFDYLQPSIDYAFVKEPFRVSNMHVFSLKLNL